MNLMINRKEAHETLLFLAGQIQGLTHTTRYDLPDGLKTELDGMLSRIEKVFFVEEKDV